jgi:hypothetical protein
MVIRFSNIRGRHSGKATKHAAEMACIRETYFVANIADGNVAGRQQVGSPYNSKRYVSLFWAGIEFQPEKPLQLPPRPAYRLRNTADFERALKITFHQ